MEVTLGIEEEEEEVGEGVESVVLSSLSDSYEEDEDESPSHGQATPRPRLRPFFGSDTLSLVSGTQVSHTQTTPYYWLLYSTISR